MSMFDILIFIFIIILLSGYDGGKSKKSKKKTYYRRRKRSTYSSVSRRRNKKYRRGEQGEIKLRNELEQKIPGEKRILTNLYTFKEDGTLNEIDIVLIHSTGIFVIESKNYRGYISGNRYRKEWNQTFYAKSKKITNKFYNPIYQNYGHICSLQKMLSLNNRDYFKSYIAFGDSARIEHVIYSDEEIRITNYSNIVNHLIDDIARKRNIFTPSQMDLYYNKLSPFCHKNDDISQKHIDSVKSKKNNEQPHITS